MTKKCFDFSFQGVTNVATKTKEPNRLESVNGAVKAENVSVVIARIEPKLVEIEIVGISQLLVCAWSTKARQQMLDKQMKKATRGKSAKDPEADYKASLYVSTEGWTGIPAGGVKGCMVAACRATDIPVSVSPYRSLIHAISSADASRWSVVIGSVPACSCSIPIWSFWPGQCAERTISLCWIAVTVNQRPTRMDPFRQTRKLWPESFQPLAICIA